MARVTAEIVPGEVTQEQWDAKYGATTKKLNEMGGAQTTDDLPEGTSNKYDTGAPPADTDTLAEGSVNKYDTGVPPATLEELADGATRKAMLDAEKTKLTGIEADAKDDQTGAEIQVAIMGLSDPERKIVASEPQSGEHKIYGIHRNAAGNIEYEHEETPEA